MKNFVKILIAALFFTSIFMVGCKKDPEKPSNPGSGNTPTIGAINGLFTINSNGDRVYFSQGNLQYQASTNTWRFAENQWDYVGNASLGTVYENNIKCDNSLISETYSGWIDMFGCGTGETPTLHTMNMEDYESHVDWGVNIDMDTADWRTLSRDEWIYVTEMRDNADQLIGTATVNNVVGYVLLPDDFMLPSGGYFQSGANDWDNNIYSISQWQDMENAGAVFLPAGGYRNGTSCFEVQTDGHFGHWAIPTGGITVITIICR